MPHSTSPVIDPLPRPGALCLARSDGHHPGDEHGRGLAIIEAIAGDGNWGIDGDTACHVVWFRLNWHQDQAS